MLAAMGEAIASWGAIEAELGRAMAELLHTDVDVAVEMYLAITSPAGRHAVLEAAARAALSGDTLLLFLALLIMAGRVYTERNKIAHCTWGISTTTPDVLLSIPTKCILRFVATWKIIDSKIKPLTGRLSAETLGLDRELITVYKAQDFRAITKRASGVRSRLFRFSVIGLKGKLAQEFNKLKTEPEVAAVLVGVRKCNPHSASITAVINSFAVKGTGEVGG